MGKKFCYEIVGDKLREIEKLVKEGHTLRDVRQTLLLPMSLERFYQIVRNELPDIGRKAKRIRRKKFENRNKEIVREFCAGRQPREIAEKYKLSVSTIYWILKNERWEVRGKNGWNATAGRI